MNDLLFTVQCHYNERQYFLFFDPGATDARAMRYDLTGKMHTVVWREAVDDVGKIAAQIERLSKHAPNDVLVLATWKDGLTIGDEAELKAAGVTVLTFAREAEHV